MTPFGPDSKSFFCPSTERDRFDHCWGDDSTVLCQRFLLHDPHTQELDWHVLFAGETAPGDGIQTLLVSGLEITIVIASEVSHLIVLVELCAQSCPVLAGAEKFDERLILCQTKLASNTQELV